MKQIPLSTENDLKILHCPILVHYHKTGIQGVINTLGKPRCNYEAGVIVIY